MCKVCQQAFFRLNRLRCRNGWSLRALLRIWLRALLPLVPLLLRTLRLLLAWLLAWLLLRALRMLPGGWLPPPSLLLRSSP